MGTEFKVEIRGQGVKADGGADAVLQEAEKELSVAS